MIFVDASFTNDEPLGQDEPDPRLFASKARSRFFTCMPLFFPWHSSAIPPTHILQAEVQFYGFQQFFLTSPCPTFSICALPFVRLPSYLALYSMRSI